MLLEIPDANHIQTPTRKSCPLAPHNLPRAFSRARTHTFFNLSRSLSALSLPTRSKSTNLCSDNLIALATMSHFDGAKDTLGQAKGFAQDKTDASIGEAQKDCDSCGRAGHHAALAAGEKWDQAKQGASDLVGSAHEKAGHASDKAGSMLGSVNAAQTPS